MQMLQGITQRLDLMLAKEGDGWGQSGCAKEVKRHTDVNGVVNTVQGVHLCVHRGASEDQRPG